MLAQEITQLAMAREVERSSYEKIMEMMRIEDDRKQREREDKRDQQRERERKDQREKEERREHDRLEMEERWK